MDRLPHPDANLADQLAGTSGKEEGRESVVRLFLGVCVCVDQFPHDRNMRLILRTLHLHWEGRVTILLAVEVDVKERHLSVRVC